MDNFESEENWSEYEALKKAWRIVKKAKRTTKAPCVRPTLKSFLQSKQPEFQLQPALPHPPAQTQQQQLKNSTWLSSIVSEGYKETHRGINWPHYENMLKLYALGALFKNTLTPQQQKDKADLGEAIEYVYNTKNPRKKEKSANEILQKATGVYMQYGFEVIDAMVLGTSLSDLRDRIYRSHVREDREQREKMFYKSYDIVRALRARYKQK